MQITGDRIRMVNELYGTQTAVAITDLYHADGTPAGTKVILTIPLNISLIQPAPSNDSQNS